MVLVDQRDEKIEVQQVSHRLGQVIFSEILHFIRSDDLSGFRYYQKPATSPLQRGDSMFARFDICWTLRSSSLTAVPNANPLAAAYAEAKS
jgi:hypothetical protein